MIFFHVSWEIKNEYLIISIFPSSLNIAYIFDYLFVYLSVFILHYFFLILFLFLFLVSIPLLLHWLRSSLLFPTHLPYSDSGATNALSNEQRISGKLVQGCSSLWADLCLQRHQHGKIFPLVTNDHAVRESYHSCLRKKSNRSQCYTFHHHYILLNIIEVSWISWDSLQHHFILWNRNDFMMKIYIICPSMST